MNKPVISSAWRQVPVALADRPWVGAIRRLERVAIKSGPMLLGALMLGGALLEFRHIHWGTVAAMLPTTPAFWLVFACAYLTPPVADWLIYRRLWGLDRTALPLLVKKMISNELIIGYAGEAGLYAHARASGRDGKASLAEIKDVSILSAAVGNGVTLVAALIALPALSRLQLPVPAGAALALAAVVLLPPIAAVTFRGSLFRLPGADLRFVAAAHGGRALVSNALVMLAWHLALPEVAMGTWGLLIAIKLIASRLPLVSNKDLVFASAAVALLGAGAPGAALMTLVATLSTVTHALLGAGMGATAACKRSASAKSLIVQG